MRLGFGAALAVTSIVSLSAVAYATDGLPQPPANDDCLACHSETRATRGDGTPVFVDHNKLAASTHGQMGCVDCHTDVAGVKEYPHAGRLAKVRCATCHDTVQQQYHDSIHSRARERAGLVVAPSCVDCHGNHDIRQKTDRASRVFRANIPSTCGKCHAGLLQRYDVGIHASAVKRGDSRAPVCADCHTAHSIQRADTDAWRLSATSECGSCHANVVGTYRRTFHGKVTELGFTRVAACSDCHGAHDILPASNPASTVSVARRVSTCARCHPGANESFAKYDPHPDPRNYRRSPLLWWINQFYTVLITGCFGFFGLHSLLWFRRSRKEQRRAAAAARAPSEAPTSGSQGAAGSGGEAPRPPNDGARR